MKYHDRWNRSFIVGAIDRYQRRFTSERNSAVVGLSFTTFRNDFCSRRSVYNNDLPRDGLFQKQLDASVRGTVAREREA